MTSRCALYTRACKSAPEYPAVAAAILSRSMEGDSVTFRPTAFRICYSSVICSYLEIQCQRTSLRSSKSGMPHKMDLSKRPGRSNAGSIRSGRLLQRSGHIYEHRFVHTPSGSQNINPFQPFSTIHLCEHLIDDTIRYSSTIMTPVRIVNEGPVGRAGSSDRPFGCDGVKFIKKQHTRFGGAGTLKQISHLSMRQLV